MRGKILSFRRGLHTQKNTQIIIEIEGINNKEKAKELIGKEIVYKNRKLGRISAFHGNKGKMRVILYKGIDGKLIGENINIK